MKNPKSRKGGVEVFLTRNFFNSLVSVLSEFIQADETNKYAVYAQRLKKKILTYGRTFTHEGEETAVVYFYEDEAALLIKLMAIYVNATEDCSEDFFFQIGKGRNTNDES